MNRHWRYIYTMVSILILFSVQTLFARAANEQKLETIKEMYDIAMKSDVDGLVESAIYQVILMKRFYPGENYSDLIETIDHLSLEGNTLQIRYKAQLASIFLKNPVKFNDIRLESAPDPVPFFRMLSDRVEELALSTASL